MAILMASVALSPVSPINTPARADGKDVIAGLIVGGIIGSAVANDNNRKKKSTGTSTASSAARTANKEVQTALNYFGYNVGTPDGSIGPKSRAAISEYQAFLGYPATGELTENERLILVTAYQRGMAGGSLVAETVSSSPYGMKALLVAQRDEMSGLAPATSLAEGTVAPADGSVGAATAAADIKNAATDRYCGPRYLVRLGIGNGLGGGEHGNRMDPRRGGYLTQNLIGDSPRGKVRAPLFRHRR